MKALGKLIKVRLTFLVIITKARVYVYVSEGKKCSLFGKFGVLCFLVIFVLKFAISPYFRRHCSHMEDILAVLSIVVTSRHVPYENLCRTINLII